MARPRILLVDDHHLVLDGLRLALRAGHEIVGALTTGAEVVEACRKLRPDVVLLDHSLPDRSGLEIVSDLRAALPRIKILIVTMYNQRMLAEAMLQAGAHGFVPKDADAEELRHAIREVLAGRSYTSSLVPQRGAEHSAEELAFGLSRLSPRQREIVRLLGQGMSSAEIAEELGLTPYAITFHRARIRKLLGLDSEWRLQRFALLAGMSQSGPRTRGGKAS